jgi:glycosyltransferase involved in cell wall biosynthesis
MIIKTIGVYAYCKNLSDTTGGVESQVVHISRALLRNGYRVIVHCLSSDIAGWSVQSAEFRVQNTVKKLDEDLIEVCPVPGPGIEGAVRANTEISHEFGESLILMFGTRDGYVFSLALQAAALLNIAAVAFVYFTAEERQYRSQFISHTRSIPGLAEQEAARTLLSDGEKVLRQVFEHSSLVFVPTHYVRGQLSNILPSEHLCKLTVAYHGVDENLFYPRELDWAFGSSWLHVSRVSIPFSSHKNYFWTLEFLKAALSHFPQAHVSIAGEGNAKPLMQQYAIANKLEKNVRLCGFLDQAQLRNTYENSNILLVPSMMEAGATTIVESILVGCLPVVLDYAGAPEVLSSLGLSDFLLPSLVRDRGFGIKSIEPDTAFALNLMKKIEEMSEDIPNMMHRARQRALEQYSINVTTRQVVNELYRRRLIT